MKIKIKTGYREDQYYTIDLDEAHKAYYLFLNPEERGVFENGVALIGKNIQGIEPDYTATMGWHPTHKLDADDWNEINKSGVHTQLMSGLAKAKEIANLIEDDKSLAEKKLSEITFIEEEKLPIHTEIKKLSDGFRWDKLTER